MKRFLCSLVLSAIGLFGQDYTVSYTATLTGTADAVTIQQPATNADQIVHLVGAYVYCSAECAVTLERTGTAATTLAIIPAPVLPGSPASAVAAFGGSDVGAGTELGTYTLPGSGSMILNLSSLYLYGPGTTRNYTLRFASMTGTIKVVIQFRKEA